MLNAFLKRSRQNFIKYIESPSSVDVQFVLGNQSGDLDSVVCSISHAFFQDSTSAHDCVPVLNFSRKELGLRKELLYVCEELNLNAANFCFVSELPQNACNVPVILVDHNASTVPFLQNVVSIIDHHKDEKRNLEAKPRIIQPVGSCSSLVGQFWSGVPNTTISAEMATLLLAPLLVDTSNLKYKQTKVDLDMYAVYKGICPDLDTQGFFERLSFEKENLEGLSVEQILIKDYKKFDFSGKAIGIASMTKPMAWLFEKHADVSKCCREFAGEHKLDLLVIMSTFTENGTFRRQLSLVPASDKKLFSLVATELESSDLQLESVERIADESDDLCLYDQLNVKSSRKQVAPLLETILANAQ